MKQSSRILSALLAGSIALSPALSWADGVVNLPPLQDPANPSPVLSSAAYSQGSTMYDSMPLRGRVSSVPRGTQMVIKLDQPVSTFTSRVGDTVSATLENDIFVNDAIAIPAGSQVTGQITNIAEAGRIGRHGHMDLRFYGIKTPEGASIPISAHIVTTDETGVLKGDTYSKAILKGVGISAGGAGVGTLMGTAAGGLVGSAGTGAILGLGVGAIGGMSYALLRKGKEVVVPANARMGIQLDQPVNVNI